jgi:regulator of replication initiation timing
MGKVYREFSRQKYNKYKHQFPKMRESEIVSKIIKEWDALGNVAKGHLQKIYEKNKVLTLEDISSSEQLMKSELQKKEAARKSAQKTHKSTSEPIPVTKIFPQTTTAKHESDSDFNRDSHKDESNRGVESSSPKLVVVEKTKKIVKIDYISFYKQKYERLHAQHPRWTPKQISGIIKLEWRKNKNEQKKPKKAGRLGTRRSSRLLSGYLFFRKHRGYTSKETIQKWRHFPVETKHLWINIAQNKKPEPKREKLNLRCS